VEIYGTSSSSSYNPTAATGKQSPYSSEYLLLDVIIRSPSEELASNTFQCGCPISFVSVARTLDPNATCTVSNPKLSQHTERTDRYSFAYSQWRQRSGKRNCQALDSNVNEPNHRMLWASVWLLGVLMTIFFSPFLNVHKDNKVLLADQIVEYSGQRKECTRVFLVNYPVDFAQSKYQLEIHSGRKCIWRSYARK